MLKSIVKGYKFRIYPTKEQEEFFAKSFGCCRFVWNYFLNERKEFYLKNKENEKKGLNYYDNAKSLTKLKKGNEFEWLAEVDSQSLQMSLRYLEIAYERFFKKKTKFPKFKSKHENQSFTVTQSFGIESNKFWIPKLKTLIKFKQDRDFDGNHKIKHLVISKTKTNKYYVSFIVEEDQKLKKKSKKSIGIDLGLDNLMTFSDGTDIKNPKITKKQRKKLEYQQRQLSKKKLGGKNREKARLQLALTYEKISNIKTDFMHKLTSKIIDENQVVICEDLDVVGMMKNRWLARAIGEVSWYEIIRQLKYKAEWNDRTFIQIDRYFPSSQICFDCNYVNQDLLLKDREWTCPKCGENHDRDINAAKNILKQGLNIFNSGEGLPSEPKQKLEEASKKVPRNRKDNRVVESGNFQSNLKNNHGIA